MGKIVIFGAGSGGQKIAHVLNNDFNYYVDNDENKIGTIINGKEVFSPNKLLSENKNEILVLVYSFYSEEISQELNEKDLINGKHYIITNPKDLLLKVMNKSIKELFYDYKKRLLISEIYEPIMIDGELLDDTLRGWQERWKMIQKEIINYQVSNIIDVGCAEGWFLRRAAEDMGCFGIGLEMNDTSIALGELARLHDGVERCSIMKLSATPRDLIKLPQFDMVFCLSVVHHIVYKEGIEAGKEFMSALSKITKKAMIFEMGTVDEYKTSWHKDMPPMPRGQEEFIKEFLLSSEWKNIRVLGKTPSIKNEAERVLVVAEPNSKI